MTNQVPTEGAEKPEQKAKQETPVSDFAELKPFIWDIITKTDEFDKQGLSKPIQVIEVAYIRGMSRLKKELRKFLEMGVASQDPKKTEIEWLPFSEYSEMDEVDKQKLKVVSEKWIKGVIELDDMAKEALIHYYAKRTSLREVSEEVFDAFENLIK